MTTTLIVDDNLDNLYLLRCLLEADGFDVVEAGNGREALDRAGEREIDLVISDILMPVMDGFSLCREWKSNPRLKAIPFVFYTATYVDKKDEDLAMSLGADQFIIKATDPVLLRERLAEVLTRKRSGAPTRGLEPATDTSILQQYNSVLIHKLEHKVLELEKANKALRVKDFALTSSASGIVLASISGQVTYANPAMLRLCGKSESEIVGQPVEGFFTRPELLSRWKAGDMAEGQQELQLAQDSQGASPVWLQVAGHAVNDDRGQSLGLMLSCVDVSEQKRLRQEVSRISRLEAISLFAAGVAHDFNNLLVPISAALELGADAPEREENQAMGMAAFERARELTRRLLTFSKGSTTKRQAVDLRRLLDESISLAMCGSGVRCERQYSDQLVSATGDSGQLAQVFSNLLVNARQAMKEQGTIVVSASLSMQQAQGVLPPGRYAVIRIADDGPGIPPEVLPKIFDPYFTTKAEGNGLGLATSQAIVHEHGGWISVSTRPGAGTAFEIMLPASADEPGQAYVHVPRLTHASSGRVLVMDDQVAIQALLQRGLEQAGYEVVVTNNGEQALLEFDRAKEGGRPFDLVILDITVRGGMGGLETLSKLRSIESEVLVLAMTGYYEDTLEGLRGKGFAHVLFKPFLIHEMLGTVRAILER